MSDTSRDLLIRGIAAAKAGDKKEARFYLEWLLRLEPHMDEKKEAWFYLSEISDDPAEKRRYLEELLSNDLWDARARRALAIVDGKLKPEQVVDPNRIQAPAAPQEQQGGAKRFTCPQCGGRMTYAPDGHSLICEYCETHQHISRAKTASSIDGDDFIIGLAQAKGHSTPVRVHSITCKGCGAVFILPASQLSKICPYCQSAYVLETVTETDTIAPDLLIPFRVNEANAKLALRRWFQERSFETRPRVAAGTGLYLPAWCFDVGGNVEIKYEVQVSREVWEDQIDLHIMMQQDILVPAAKKLPEALQPVYSQFNIKESVPYDEAYLANWLAENYQVSMADASLDARVAAINREKLNFFHSISQPFRNLRMDSSTIQVESYQLVLLPVWLTQYIIGEEHFSILVNGQNGGVLAEEPQKEGWLKRILG